MITIQAHMKVNPAKREEFLEKVQELITHSQAEEGNVSYQLFEDSFSPNSFAMLEEWKDETAIQLHNQSAHFVSFIKFAKDGVLIEPLQAKTFPSV
ncbi:antibiotic biosynthesis monooxygenase [Priestia megaterium]|nr:antibiotic biosynthesis monooxygenase [Priestia megaterium]